jgi:hypothetical protein
MRETFEDWAKAEISRLRAEADTLQRALNKYLESQGATPIDAGRLNGGTLSPSRSRITPTQTRKGSKREFVLSKIGESLNGATTEDLFPVVQQRFPDMKRSSLRALLYIEKRSGHLDQRNDGRYVLIRGNHKQDRPSAPTLDLSD